MCTRDYLHAKHVINKEDKKVSHYQMIEEIEDNVLMNEITCPHCFTDGFHISKVGATEAIRDYTMKTPAQNAYVSSSPVRIGESFEDLKRKMIPFKVASNEGPSSENKAATGAIKENGSPRLINLALHNNHVLQSQNVELSSSGRQTPPLLNLHGMSPMTSPEVTAGEAEPHGSSGNRQNESPFIISPVDSHRMGEGSNELQGSPYAASLSSTASTVVMNRSTSHNLSYTSHIPGIAMMVTQEALESPLLSPQSTYRSEPHSPVAVSTGNRESFTDDLNTSDMNLSNSEIFSSLSLFDKTATPNRLMNQQGESYSILEESEDLGMTSAAERRGSREVSVDVAGDSTKVRAFTALTEKEELSGPRRRGREESKQDGYEECASSRYNNNPDLLSESVENMDSLQGQYIRFQQDQIRKRELEESNQYLMAKNVVIGVFASAMQHRQDLLV
jgi:hypothetical protein